MATETVNITTTLADDSVTNAQLAEMNARTIKLRATGTGLGNPIDGSPDQASEILDFATDPFVRTSALPSGGGDVVGPASATDNAIARYDLTTGKLIQNSGITIADGATGTLSGTNTGDQDLSSYATTAAVAAGYQPLDSDLTAIAGLSPSNDDIIQRKAGAWTNRSLAQLLSDFLFTTIGLAYARLTNPSAVTFPRQNADNTVTSRTAAELLTDLGFGPTLLSVAGPLSTPSASLANVTGAVFNSVPVGMLEVQFMIDYDSAATTVGAYFSIDGTATHNYLGVNVLYNTTQGDNPSRSSVAFNSGGTSTSSRTTTGNIATVNVRINVTVSGTIQLRYATESAGNAITVQSVTGFLTKVG